MTAQTAIIYGGGPTLSRWRDDYAPPGSVTIAVNSTIFHVPEPHLFFLQDTGKFTGAPNGYWKRKAEYDAAPVRIGKRFGVHRDGKHQSFQPTAQDCQDAGARGYSLRTTGEMDFAQSQPYYENQSVVFTALQFAVMAKSKRIILVGCDVTDPHRIGETQAWSGYAELDLLGKWEYAKKQLAKHAPHVTVEVFNPVGLRDMFKEFTP